MALLFSWVFFMWYTQSLWFSVAEMAWSKDGVLDGYCMNGSFRGKDDDQESTATVLLVDVLLNFLTPIIPNHLSRTGQLWSSVFRSHGFFSPNHPAWLTPWSAEHHNQAPVAWSPQLVDLLRQKPNGTLRLLIFDDDLPGILMCGLLTQMVVT